MADESPSIYCLRGEGSWYACEAGPRFVGCCRHRPCQSGCRDEDVLPVYLNSVYNGTFPDLECDGGQFYSCTAVHSGGFIGCCKSNPCLGTRMGCDYSDMSPAHLPNNTKKRDFYLNVTSFAQEHPVHALDPTLPPTIAKASSTTTTGRPTAAIAGYAVMSLAVLLLIASVFPYVVLWIREKRARGGTQSVER